MTLFETIIISIVEGLTEFLPVSSTGHMIIAQSLLGVESDDFVKAFTVIIQFGAILSVVVLYWNRFFKVNAGSVFDHPNQPNVGPWRKMQLIATNMLYKYDFYWKLLVGFIPAAVLGLLFSDQIDALLESVMVVAIMLVLGGVFMLFVDRLFNRVDEDQSVTERKAFMIGLFQCIAMIPGVSRSMATIVGGMSQRLSRKSAAEFSFFLAVPTMFAATAYKLLKLFLSPMGKDLLVNHIGTLVVGNVVAFIVAMGAIRFFIGFVTRYGFKFFGYYRIVVGSAIIIMLMMGVNLEV